jgi:hypothetical protein
MNTKGHGEQDGTEHLVDTPVESILPQTKARRGLGVTSSFCGMPLSRSMMM